MKELLKDFQNQIEATRILIKQAQTREELDAHIQHLEELLEQQARQSSSTLQKPYLSTNQGTV